MFARIALLSAPYSTLTYALPDIFPEDFWQEGLRVAIPLGRGALRAGILMERLEHSDLPDGVTCKEVAWPLETAPLLSEEIRALARDLAIRQGLEPGCVFGHVLPQGLRQVDPRIRWLAADRDFSCTVKQVTKLEPDLRQALAVALCRGEARLVAPGRDAAGEELCVLRVDPPWPVRPQAARQREILDYLHERGQVSRRQLTRDLGAGSAPALRSLLQAGFVALRHAEADEPADELLPPAPRAFELNADQQRALEALRAALETERPASVLLFGVTGSGKTAVYLELIRHCMEQGRSVLLLAPEVALACKLRRDAACVLPHVPLFFYHGYQPPARREEIFRRLATRQEPCLVVGTRSALFLPVPQLGCVILDEEHDSSFKQDESLPYQAKELAWSRIARQRGLLVLGSATPDIKTFHAASQGQIDLLRLPERVGGRPLPPVELVDTSGLAGEGLLAARSEQALREVLQRGEQAVVLLNRRGYAPLLYCLDCKETVSCPHCHIALTYHKGRGRLVCHYCGYAVPFPSPCPKCRSMNFLPMGEGTERLEEYLSTLAGQPVLRLDRDSTRRPGRMEEILAAFARHESPILVGTQMLSKGHHFPDVTLAIVADGDLGLNLPDYRAAERSFQLLVQSAGRAGRGDIPITTAGSMSRTVIMKVFMPPSWPGGDNTVIRLSCVWRYCASPSLRKIPVAPRRWGSWPVCCKPGPVSWACACWGLSRRPWPCCGGADVFPALSKVPTGSRSGCCTMKLCGSSAPAACGFSLTLTLSICSNLPVYFSRTRDFTGECSAVPAPAFLRPLTGPDAGASGICHGRARQGRSQYRAKRICLVLHGQGRKNESFACGGPVGGPGSGCGVVRHG